jgi:diaminopimelate epimerase
MNLNQAAGRMPFTRMPFTKMHGAGNDFLLVLARDLPPGGLTRARIAALCDRRKGVGGDGLLVVGPDPAADFRMTYYNADGGEAEMCGNGARCTVAFAHAQGLAAASCRFVTASGVLEGRIHAPDDIEVSLPAWRNLVLDIPVAGSARAGHHACDTGVPHLVVPVDDVDAVDVAAEGPPLRWHEAFAPAGTNVDWVDARGPDGAWRLRTFERGVEGETLACGTGAAATAVVLCALGHAESPVSLQTRGGDRLTVTVMEDPVRTLRLRGPAVVAFHGEAGV